MRRGESKKKNSVVEGKHDISRLRRGMPTSGSFHAEIVSFVLHLQVFELGFDGSDDLGIEALLHFDTFDSVQSQSM